MCLEEWTTGNQIDRDLDVMDMEAKYNIILNSMIVAENDAYASPILKTMYMEWWNHALYVMIIPHLFIFLLNILIFQISSETNGLQVSNKLNLVLKTYGPPPPLSQSGASWDILSEAPCTSSGASSSQVASWGNDEPYHLLG
jgi:hypothetical protein